MFDDIDFEVMNGHITWKILNFSFLPQKSGYCISSPEFSLDSSGITNVRLDLYPRGTKRASHNYVSVYLQRQHDKGKGSIRAELTFAYYESTTFVKANRKVICSLARGESAGLDHFKRNLPDVQKDASDDSFTLKCDVCPDFRPSRTAKLHIEENLRNLSKDFAAFLDSGIHSDAKITVGREEFRVHKVILQTRLPMLARKLQKEPFEDLQECGGNPKTDESLSEGDFIDTTPGAMRALLKFCYSGTLENPPSLSLGKLYFLADKYNESDLKRRLFMLQRFITIQSLINVKTATFLWNLEISELADELCSPVVLIGDVTWSWFYVVLRSSNEDYVEISIRQVSFDRSKAFVLDCEVKGSNQQAEYKGEHYFETDKEEWRISKLFCKKDLYLEGSQNTMGICFDFKISDGEVVSDIKGGMLLNSVTEYQSQHLKCLLKLQADLGYLYVNQDLCDVKFCIQDVTIPAHKAILCARSAVFCRMFESSMSEAATGTVTISDIEAPVFQMLLRFMYTAATEDLDIEKAVGLYFAADKYEVLDLKQKCSSYLKSNVTVDNVGTLLVLADAHNDEYLKLRAKDFMCDHAKEVLASKEWRKIMHNRQDLAEELLVYVMPKLPSKTSSRRS